MVGKMPQLLAVFRVTSWWWCHHNKTHSGYLGI